MARLPLANSDLTTEVSPEDLAYLLHWDWFLNCRYVSRGERLDGKYRRILLHCVIARRMGLVTRGKEVDHKDRNRLNNKRDNLRAVTRSRNQHNAGARCDSSTGHRGITRRTNRNTLVVRIQVDKKRVYLGDYLTLDAAIAARSNAEGKLLNAQT
jgi:hypothetical protein